MVDKTDIEFRNLSASLIRERDILQKLRTCQFVTDLHASFQGQQEACFLLEFCPGGDLFERLSLEGPFDEETARFYVAQMAYALDQVHSLGVVFRDLKPENILFDAQGYLKLADFGCSMDQTEGVSGTVGTPEYMAPEMVDDYRTQCTYDFRVDRWALGCLMFELLSGRAPFLNKNRKKLYDAILNQKPLFHKKISAPAKDLIRQLLSKDPSKRPSFEQIKAHAWFRDFDWKALIARTLPAPWVPNTNDDLGISNFNRKFVEMEFDAINCGMSDGFWMEGFDFEAPGIEWIRRDFEPSHVSEDEEGEWTDSDTRDEEGIGMCGSLSDMEWSEPDDPDDWD